MKKYRWVLGAIIISINTVQCNFASSEQSNMSLQSSTFITLRDSIQIPDPLNELYFKVVVEKTERKGAYKILANYGYNEGEGLLVLPKGGENCIPVLSKKDGEMKFKIGFKNPSETEKIYPYFEVDASGSGMKMGYTNAYNFQ